MRTDDPVRMYLREMGAVELLSREGEIAIAKRIEAGRDMMIMGLCQSPITFHAIIQWSEALNAEEMQLREILDLDAMLSKEPPPEKMEAGEDEDDDGEISEETAGPTIRDDDEDEDSEEEGEEGEEGSTKRKRTTPCPLLRWKPRSSRMPSNASRASPTSSASSKSSRRSAST
jgi:RNA polymerase primary sigma factor